MELSIHLPQSTGFYVVLDEETIHSKYENIKIQVPVKRGTHVLRVLDQAPTPSFLAKILKFFNPLNEDVENFSEEIRFTLLEDAVVTFDIAYGKFPCVDIILGESLSQMIENAEEVF